MWRGPEGRWPTSWPGVPNSGSQCEGLVKSIYEKVLKANHKEIINMVTDADGHYIWDTDVMTEDMDNKDDDKDIDIQEEGVPAPPDWVHLV